MTHEGDSGATPAERAPRGAGQDERRGLAQERTELAWIRTALAFAALGGAMLKLTPALGIVVLGASGLVWVIRHLARRTAGEGAHDQRGLLLLITIAVIFVSLVALVAALVGSGVRLHVHY